MKFMLKIYPFFWMIACVVGVFSAYKGFEYMLTMRIDQLYFQIDIALAALFCAAVMCFIPYRWVFNLLIGASLGLLFETVLYEAKLWANGPWYTDWRIVVGAAVWALIILLCEKKFEDNYEQRGL